MSSICFASFFLGIRFILLSLWGIITGLALISRRAQDGIINGMIYSFTFMRHYRWDSGFYGTPWSQSQRRDLLRVLSQQGLTTYVYAPKDDVKHRKEWREKYGTEEAGLIYNFCCDGDNSSDRPFIMMSWEEIQIDWCCIQWLSCSRTADIDWVCQVAQH